MTTDPGLELAVDRFVETLTPVLEDVVRRLPDTAGRLDDVELDVTLEAYNLTCAFIDADELATDEELWALIATFAPRLDSQLVRATPDDVRDAKLTEGRRAWLDRPSTLAEILIGLDVREGTDYATVYYEQALAIAHTVASLDLHHSRTELLTIERYRGMLLEAIKAGGPGATVSPPSGPGASTATPAPTGQKAGPGPDEPGPARPLDDLLAELDGLVGLAPVKEEVKLVANLVQVQNLRRRRGLAVLETSHHLVFTGNPGTGKTTVARLVAQIYRTLGVVERGQLVETDRAGLVAGYVGQTAQRVTEAFDRADQGVLLIDEAYALVRGGEHDFGREAIDTIVKLVEDRRDRIVVIAAGYPDEMVEFVEANPGLQSRFPKTIHFPDYSTDELVAIVARQCDEAHYRLDDDARARVRSWLDAEPREKGFGNGRVARNLFETAVARQASRIVTLTEPTDEQLVTLVGADIPDPTLH